MRETKQTKYLQNAVDFIHAANNQIKFPKIKLQTNDGIKLQLSIAGYKAKFPGSINITSGGGFSESVFYGRIHTNGGLDLRANAAASIYTLLTAFDKNPLHEIKIYASLTSTCCFCGMPLSTPESVTAGYGNICAAHYGLPWGHIKQSAIEEEIKLPKSFNFAEKPEQLDLPLED